MDATMIAKTAAGIVTEAGARRHQAGRDQAKCIIQTALPLVRLVLRQSGEGKPDMGDTWTATTMELVAND